MTDPNPRPELRILGAIEVRASGELLVIGGRRQRRLIALLASRIGRTVDVGVLVEYVWDDDERPTNAAHAIRTYVSRLRTVLRSGGCDPEQILVTEAPGYRLALDAIDFDCARFEQLVLFARSDLDRGEAASALRALEEALGLWRGLPFAEFCDREWAQAESTRLVELSTVAIEQLCEAQIELGAHAAAVAQLEQLVSVHELRPRPVELLMLALHRCGRQIEAMRVASRHRRVLREAGLDPTAGVVDLERRVVNPANPVESTRQSRPPRRDERGALPAVPTSFVGRSAELERLGDALRNCGLITLLGVAGVGKTRLAVRLGVLHASEFRDGVCFCDLAALERADALEDAVASTLGLDVARQASIAEAIVDALVGRRLLLILDNCEHVADRAGALAHKLITCCPTLTVIATSREALGVEGERVWPVTPMNPDGDGLALFCERAVSADASFSPTPIHIASVAQLCRRLDGLPLAIELAAGRIRSTTIAELVRQLDDRFRVLRGSRRAAVPRHQTLRAAIDWSYRLLSSEEQALFRSLALFVGSFDRTSAVSVANVFDLVAIDVAHHLDSLVDQSMVVAARTETGTRYSIHESLRQYGQDLLDDGELEQLRSVCTAHCLTAAREADKKLCGDDWVGGVSAFQLHWDNIGASHGWALERGDLGLATQIVEATSWYAALKVRHEHRQWADQTIAACRQAGVTISPGVLGIASWWSATSDGDRVARDLALAGIDAAPTPTDPTTNWCWHALVLTSMYERDWKRYESALAHWEQANREPSLRFHRSLMAVYRSWHGSPADRHDGTRLAAALAARTNNPSLLIWRSWATGMTLTSIGDQDRAISSHRTTLELARQAGHHVMEVAACVMLSISLLRARRLDVGDHLTVLDTVRRTRLQAGPSIAALAQILYLSGDEENAAVLFGFLERHFPDITAIHPMLAELRSGEPELVARIERGANLTLADTLDVAREVLEQRQVVEPASAHLDLGHDVLD